MAENLITQEKVYLQIDVFDQGQQGTLELKDKVRVESRDGFGNLTGQSQLMTVEAFLQNEDPRFALVCPKTKLKLLQASGNLEREENLDNQHFVKAVRWFTQAKEGTPFKVDADVEKLVEGSYCLEPEIGYSFRSWSNSSSLYLGMTPPFIGRITQTQILAHLLKNIE